MLFHGQPIDGVKFLTESGKGTYSYWKYPLHKNGTTVWLPKQAVVLCQQGYHFATPDNLTKWVGARAFAVEAKEATDFGGKSAASSIRLVGELNWSVKVARTFAHNVARCWGCFADIRPGDWRRGVANSIKGGVSNSSNAKYIVRTAVDKATRMMSSTNMMLDTVIRAQSHLLMAHLLDDGDTISDAMEALENVFLEAWPKQTQVTMPATIYVTL